jgi:hypothetical protein
VNRAPVAVFRKKSCCLLSACTIYILHVINIIINITFMLRPTVSRPVCLAIKHPSGVLDRIFITVRELQAFWCGVLSLTPGRVCRLPESQPAVIVSLLSVCTIYILHVIKCIYNTSYILGLCQSRLSTGNHAISLVTSAKLKSLVFPESGFALSNVANFIWLLLVACIILLHMSTDVWKSCVHHESVCALENFQWCG